MADFIECSTWSQDCSDRFGGLKASGYRLWRPRFVMQTAATAPAQTASEPIRYTLSFPAPHTHYVEVTAVVPAAGRPAVDLMMAVWTPGSYMVREYSRNVEAVTAARPDGRAMPVEKTDKNRWRVATGGAAAATVRYRLYAREMSVRTNWVEADFAMINGAPTFMTLADGIRRPHEVVIEPARGWRLSITALPEMAGGAHRYRAQDYDTLVDSPIIVGNPAVHEFTVDAKRHALVNVGEAGIFDGARAAKDVETIVRAHLRDVGLAPVRPLPLHERAHVGAGPDSRRRPRARELDGSHGRTLGDTHASELSGLARACEP